MSVELAPANQLGFPRPLTQTVKRSLTIHNPHPQPVAFKVKTTAPKQYTVRPNSGRVEGGESVVVQVILQPLAQEPPAHAKCKDKFLVQSAFITPDEEMRTLAEMWAETEKSNKNAIIEHKIKVAYLAPEDGRDPQAIQEEDETAHAEPSRVDESYSAPHDGLARWTTDPDKERDLQLFRNGGMTYWEVEQLPFTPPRSEQPGAAAIFSQAASSPVQTKSLANGELKPTLGSSIGAPIPASAREPASPSSNSASTSTAVPVLAAATESKPVVPAPTSGLKDLSASDVQAAGSPTNAALEKSVAASTSDSDKLRVALAEVERLKNQLADAQSQGPSVTGLRRRGGAVAGGETLTEKAKDVVSAGGSQGVPVEVVVALCLGVFVVTYLFF